MTDDIDALIKDFEEDNKNIGQVTRIADIRNKQKQQKETVEQSNVNKNDKIKKYREILKEDQNSLEYMENMKQLYEQFVANLEEDAEYRKIANKVYNLQQEQKIKEQKIEKQYKKVADGDEPSEMEICIKKWELILQQREMYFVTDAGKYVEYCGTQLGWLSYGVDATYRLCGCTTGIDKLAFTEAMCRLGRNKRTTSWEFNVSDETILQLIRQDEWLKPTTGDVHPLIQILLRSLAGGREEIVEHIEQVVAWKYLHPEDYELPCLVISGAGGVGKNQFVSGILETIFGKSQVATLGYSSVFGDYTGLRLGKTVVFVDETITEKKHAAAMKQIVGNRTVEFNHKHGQKGYDFNTPMYIIGGNDKAKTLLLEGTPTDRRWSIIHVDESIMPHIRRHFGFALLSNPLPGQEKEQQSIEWWNENRWVLKDNDEVAKWLNHILVKWGTNSKRPNGWHGEDYEKQIEMQRTPTEEFCEIVFRDKNFSHITQKTLWEIFKLWAKDNAQSVYHKARKQSTLSSIREWVERSGLEITPNVKYKYPTDVLGDHLKMTTGIGFSSGGKTIWDHNDDGYIFRESHTNRVMLGQKFEGAEDQYELRVSDSI